ncbi:MAG: glycosyltransferase family 2 protein [Elusimicrobia bacterium]|nr:glycosyltransferase family 2 protein [Elusimicrobiota bacterium]
MGSFKTLSIVIPAYNEEEAIEDILKKCLEARQPLRQALGLSQVEIVLVDDGSRDATSRKAAAFPEVKLVSHAVNKGYGRALMTGFEAASGEVLGFLDADGTCDPMAFIDLGRALDGGADMAVGNRIHAASQMPRLRTLGNVFYAYVISLLSGVQVNDAASGMRLFRRALLERLSPLPAGLHFTPAMSARAACMGASISETPIPYAVRQGESKLNVVGDGIRFLRVILGIIFAYYPLRIFGPLAVIFGLAALGYGLGPVLFYWKHGHLEEDMIYRLLTILTLAVCALIMGAFGLIAQRISDIAVGRSRGWLDSKSLRGAGVAAGMSLGLGGVLLNSRTILEYVSSGRISIHWVYVLVGGLSVISGAVLVAFGITLGLASHLPDQLKKR